MCQNDKTRNQGWGQVQLTKYSSTPSTPNIYQVQVLVKYSFFKKYLSTSSTFKSSTSTSTSTHIKIWIDKIKGLSLNHVCSSHILCRVDFG